jgi:hypothetical protein
MAPPTAPTKKVSTKPPLRRAPRWLLLGSLALGPALVAAAPPARAAVAQAPAPDQNSAERLRQPPAVAERLRELASQRAFDYRETPLAASSQPSSAWRRFWRRVLGWLRDLLAGPTAPSYNGFWRWVIYGLLAAAIIFVVLKLLQVDLTRAFGRAPRRAALDYETLGENIHELDFPAQLRAAEEAGNLRLAVRLGYLALLKQLSDCGLIEWQPDKTNQAYLRELASQQPALRPAFAEATRQFEYVWYGELALTPGLYAAVRADQVALGRQLGGGRAVPS